MTSMNRAGFAKRRDANELPIVRALEAVGASVTRLNVLDAPDLLVGFRGVTYLLEVKTLKGKVTDGQFAWHADWKGGRVSVVRTVEEALDAIDVDVVSPGMWRDVDGALRTYPRPDVRPG